MADWPSGTVTFLFTDVEGSTRLWEEHSEAMQHALARHDQIVVSRATEELARERERGAGMSAEEAVAHVLRTIDELEDQQSMPG